MAKLWHGAVNLLVAAGVAAVLVAPVMASEMEILPWGRITLECGNGAVVEAEVGEGNVWKMFHVRAYGGSFKLDEVKLGSLKGYPLESMQIFHEGGWEEIGGATMTITLRKNYPMAPSRERPVDIFVNRNGIAISPDFPREGKYETGR